MKRKYISTKLKLGTKASNSKINCPKLEPLKVHNVMYRQKNCSGFSVATKNIIHFKTKLCLFCRQQFAWLQRCMGRFWISAIYSPLQTMHGYEREATRGIRGGGGGCFYCRIIIEHSQNGLELGHYWLLALKLICILSSHLNWEVSFNATNFFYYTSYLSFSNGVYFFNNTCYRELRIFFLCTYVNI